MLNYQRVCQHVFSHLLEIDTSSTEPKTFCVFSWLMNSLAPCLAVGVKAFAHGWAQLHQISTLRSRDPIIGSSFLDQKLQISCNAQRARCVQREKLCQPQLKVVGTCWSVSDLRVVGVWPRQIQGTFPTLKPTPKAVLSTPTIPNW